MRVNSFFKILNRKINHYDKLATNPFTNPKRIIIVWVEDDSCVKDSINTDCRKNE